MVLSRNRQYYLKNREAILAKRRAYVAANKDRIREADRISRKANAEERKRKKAEAYQRNKERILAGQKTPAGVARRKASYQKNKAKLLARSKAWRAENKEWLRVYANNYRAKNVAARLRNSIQPRIWALLRGRSKADSTVRLLGCSLAALRQHLESQFMPEMNWGNYGSYWEIDHIVPCDAFDLTSPMQQRACFNACNLQPLTVADNRLKRNSFP